MKTPTFRCKIEAYCPIYASEDPDKVILAVTNVLPNSKIKSTKKEIKATSNDLSTIEKISDTFHSRKSLSSYRRQLIKNLDYDSTWFYLNKQAAFVNTVALCENAEESPLGPIKVYLYSEHVQDIIDWLVS